MARCFSCYVDSCGFLKSCSCTCHRDEKKFDAIVLPKSPEPILLYAVRNAEGQWFKPYTKGSSASWQDDLGFAKIYANESTAAGSITRLVNEAERNRRGGGPIAAPELVEFVVTETRVIDQKERLAKVKQKKLEIEARRVADEKQLELINAQKELDKAQAHLNKLRGETK